MNEVYIKALQDKIKTLTGEKDSLVGKLRSLEEEKELYKVHFTSSETNLQGYVMEIDTLKKSVHDLEEANSQQTQKVVHLEHLLDDERKKLATHLALNNTQQQKVADLSEQLKNTQDRLQTVEQCKKMLNDEVIAVHAAHDKMSESLEQARSEAHNLKAQVARLEDDYQVRTNTLKEEITILEKAKGQLVKQVEGLEKQASEQKTKLEATERQKLEDNEGALYALKTAQECLEKRLRSQMEDMTKAQRLKQQIECDLRHEIDDLKERLAMGADEYKQKFIECRKLQQELKKARKQVERASAASTRSGSPIQMRDSSLNTDKLSLCESYTQVMMEDVSVTKSPESSLQQEGHIFCTEDLQSQIEQLSKELETRTIKKLKYKQQLHQVKERNTVLQKQLMDEMKQYGHTLDSTNQIMMSLKTDFHQRTKNLQDVIDKQKNEIDSLRSEITWWRNQAKENSGSVSPSEAMLKPITSEQHARSVQKILVKPRAPAAGFLPYPNFSTRFSSDGSDDSDDPFLAEGQVTSKLPQPMSPLPPPMVPEVLPSAKLAAIKAAQCDQADTLQSVKIELDPLEQQQQQIEATDDADDEEGFLDARGEPQKICPVCNITYSSDHPQELFEDHVLSHFGEVCPICEKQFEKDYPQEEFESHVRDHLDAEDRAERTERNHRPRP